MVLSFTASSDVQQRVFCATDANRRVRPPVQLDGRIVRLSVQPFEFRVSSKPCPNPMLRRAAAERDARPTYIALTKAARARFDTLAAESIESVFQAILTAATQDGDLAAAKLL